MEKRYDGRSALGSITTETGLYLRFVLNATQESLPTPSRLKHWNKSSAGDGKCPLCSRFVGTLKHILCRCPHAIDEEPQSRITWRHDSILLAWKKAIEHQVESTAGKSGESPGYIQFQSAGLMEAEKVMKRVSRRHLNL